MYNLKKKDSMVFNLLSQYFCELSHYTSKHQLNHIIKINKQSFLSSNTFCLDLVADTQNIKIDLASDSKYDFSNLNNLCKFLTDYFFFGKF